MASLIGSLIAIFPAVTFSYFIKCGDTHKSYQALEIFVFGTTMEMIKTYISNTDELHSIEGFLTWQPSTTYCNWF